MKTVESTPLRRPWARIAIALAYFAGISLIVGWSLPDGVAADRPADVAMRLPEPGDIQAAAAFAKPIADAGKTRSRVNCAGCGVIESVQQDRYARIAVMARVPCRRRRRRPRPSLDVADPTTPESLANTVASVIADGRGRKKVAVTTRHQIVVRFRDGSRQVFDEATPRSLRVGDRIMVIAGTAEAKGRAGCPSGGERRPLAQCALPNRRLARGRGD